MRCHVTEWSRELMKIVNLKFSVQNTKGPRIIFSFSDKFPDTFFDDYRRTLLMALSLRATFTLPYTALCDSLW